jgi:HlyD family secretion protein
MTATLTITTEQDSDVFLVPNSALAYAQTQSRGGGAAVYVLRDGTPVRVAVRTGSSDGQNTVVLGGLEADDEIVTGMQATSGAPTTSTRSGSIFGFGPPNGGRPTATSTHTGQTTQTRANDQPPVDAGPPPPGGP